VISVTAELIPPPRGNLGCGDGPSRNTLRAITPDQLRTGAPQVEESTTEKDDAISALTALDAVLESSIAELQSARERLHKVLEARSTGSPWRDIVDSEERPLVVESLSRVLDQLSVGGSRFRRAQAQALYAEGLSMERVASLFGVTRQRVSALLRDREAS
jgi:hypothetical protein